MRCGACKYLRRSCGGEENCILAPYYPPESIQRFACVHNVFGASNVGSILKFMEPASRASAAQTLSYQAEARVRDPVHGCVGLITELEETHRKLTVDLLKAHKELKKYMSPQEIQSTCPRFCDYIKGKKVDTPMGLALLDLYPTSYPNMTDEDLALWDPFPSSQNVGVKDVDRPGPSSQVPQPQSDGVKDGERGVKRKSMEDPSSS